MQYYKYQLSIIRGKCIDFKTLVLFVYQESLIPSFHTYINSKGYLVPKIFMVYKIIKLRFGMANTNNTVDLFRFRKKAELKMTYFFFVKCDKTRYNQSMIN